MASGELVAAAFDDRDRYLRWAGDAGTARGVQRFSLLPGPTLCEGAPIAHHIRSYSHGEFVHDPLRYLALIETKPGALNQAAALQGCALSTAFQHLHHLLATRMDHRGRR